LHRNAYREVAQYPAYGGFSASGRPHNHNNFTLQNNDTPWGNSTGKRGFSDYGSFYSGEELYTPRYSGNRLGL
jgi:hypothetical protein